MSFLRKFKDTFHTSLWEVMIGVILITVFIVLRFTLDDIPLYIIILGFVVGVWLAFRPSEWAVGGLDSASKYVGFSDYTAGTISSLASNLPEAVIAIFMFTAGQHIIATVTILSAAGFNAIILGVAILIATLKKKGYVDVPEGLEKKEAPIIRWAIVALLMTVCFGFIEYFQKSDEIAILTKPVGAFLAAGYIFYLIYLAISERKSKSKMKEEGVEYEKPKLSKIMTIIILVLGFGGIILGGETLSFCVEELIHVQNVELRPEFLGLILGAAGALPEHGIALVSAAKDEVEIAFGNAIGGILQSALLIFGLLGTIFVIELSPFVLLQLAAIAVILWFTKRCITDDKRFDTFEGIMILLLQFLVFAILIEDVILAGL